MGIAAYYALTLGLITLGGTFFVKWPTASPSPVDQGSVSSWRLPVAAVGSTTRLGEGTFGKLVSEAWKDSAQQDPSLMNDLLHELLSEAQFTAAAEHWKLDAGAAGNAADGPQVDAHELRDLLRAARNLDVSNSQPTTSRPADNTNSGATGVTPATVSDLVRDWLRSAEKLAQRLPTAGRDTHAFARRALTAALLATWRAAGNAWSQVREDWTCSCCRVAQVVPCRVTLVALGSCSPY